jgi:hypothetical protein
MARHGWWRCNVVLIAVLGVLVGSLGSGARESWAGPRPVPHCISPTAVDLNVRWAISDAIVAPFCTEVNSGRQWVPSNAWFMNFVFDAAPAGFVPAGSTPLEDFIAKFIGVKYVVDPGTKKEKTYIVTNDDDLGIVHTIDAEVVNPITLGSLKPLSVGDHVVDSYLLFSAMHCDGFGDVVDENCLSGEAFFQRVEFTVKPGHN